MKLVTYSVDHEMQMRSLLYTILPLLGKVRGHVARKSARSSLRHTTQTYIIALDQGTRDSGQGRSLASHHRRVKGRLYLGEDRRWRSLESVKWSVLSIPCCGTSWGVSSPIRMSAGCYTQVRRGVCAGSAWRLMFVSDDTSATWPAIPQVD
jgi:hypothetical protein